MVQIIPRKQGLGESLGASFGQGFGSSFTQGYENYVLNRALEGVDQNDPRSVLNAIQQANVSPQAKQNVIDRLMKTREYDLRAQQEGRLSREAEETARHNKEQERLKQQELQNALIREQRMQQAVDERSRHNESMESLRQQEINIKSQLANQSDPKYKKELQGQLNAVYNSKIAEIKKTYNPRLQPLEYQTALYDANLPLEWLKFATEDIGNTASMSIKDRWNNADDRERTSIRNDIDRLVQNNLERLDELTDPLKAGGIRATKETISKAKEAKERINALYSKDQDRMINGYPPLHIAEITSIVNNVWNRDDIKPVETPQELAGSAPIKNQPGQSDIQKISPQAPKYVVKGSTQKFSGKERKAAAYLDKPSFKVKEDLFVTAVDDPKEGIVWVESKERIR